MGRMARAVLFSFFMVTFLMQGGAMAQPSIVGDWLFDIVGGDKGAAIITFDAEGNHLGYAFTLDMGVPVSVEGTYSVNSKGFVSGHLVVKEEELVVEEQDFTGKVDKKLSKLNLKLSNGPNLKGIKLPSDPVIPEDWKVKISKGGSFDYFTITRFEDNHRVYMVEGSGTIDGKEVNVSGIFILNSKFVAYGFYELSGGIEQQGVFWGKVNLAAGKFSFKAESSEGERATLSGVVVK